MSTSQILLRAYYERLHELMTARRAALVSHVDTLLEAEIVERGFAGMDYEKVAAYREACVAFVDERLESYNPIGIQYTFGRSTSRRAAELEFQLNWYDSRSEFADLVAAARSLVSAGVPEEMLMERADLLIQQASAFPDRSIIRAYRQEPALQKLPDYIVARAIEQVICGRTSLD